MSLLKHKVVLITGVGRGLGRELVQAFCAEGCTVVGITREEQGLRETEGLVAGSKFDGYAADVADFRQVADIVSECLRKHGRVDIVFNNAAVYPRVSFTDETAEEWASAIATNVNGVANVCKAVLVSMLEQGYGRIYNVGSFADISPIADSAAYSASKGAIRSLTKAIAADINDREADIEVHEWIPGHMNTRMSGFTGTDPAVAAGWAVSIAGQAHARTQNCIFENEREWLPPRGIRQRIRDRLRSLLPGAE